MVAVLVVALVFEIDASKKKKKNKDDDSQKNDDTETQGKVIVEFNFMVNNFSSC